jgi:hypothetical protein
VQLVEEADGYQPYLLSPEKGLRALVKKCLDLAKPPSIQCVDEVRPAPPPYPPPLCCGACCAPAITGGGARHPRRCASGCCPLVAALAAPCLCCWVPPSSWPLLEGRPLPDCGCVCVWHRCTARCWRWCRRLLP